jgi:anthranilate phosphoribosyltransferase
MHRYISAVGRGQKRARDLSRDEARAAMALICDGRAEPLQIGAFLLALRMKGEAADELAGFVDALDERTLIGGEPGRARAPDGTLDVDCHGDGHAGRATLLPAAACAAAALGVPVLLRADLDSPSARHGLGAALAALGVDRARPLDGARAQAALARAGIAVLDLPAYCPPLKQLVALRPKLGLRTAAQTLMKLVDPLRASRRLVGVFHAPYLPSTAGALARLGATHALCVQALGGLPEAAPGKLVRVAWSDAPEPVTIDLRQFAAAGEQARAADASAAAAGEDDESPDASAIAADENRAALCGKMPQAARAAAACALMLHAATDAAPLAAAEAALAALSDGRASAIAARFVEM